MAKLEITYIGHACFLLHFPKNNIKILTDPYDPSVGYSMNPVEANVVVCSHTHFDHCYELLAKNYTKKLVMNEQEVKTEINGIKIENIITFHDQVKGKQRGKNGITLIYGDVKVAHLGDLGHIPEEPILKKLSEMDILLIPVGGIYTIGPDEAREIVRNTNPKIVIPMHYRTKVTSSWPIKPVEEFITPLRAITKTFNTNTVSIENLPTNTEVWVLEYRK